jgi:hypothetical protein
MTSCNGPISVPSDAGPMEQRRSGLNWDRFTRGSLSSREISVLDVAKVSNGTQR